MPEFDILSLFQGIATLVAAEQTIFIGRLALITIGILLIYLGKKGVLEALIMIPMGVGMLTINAAVMFVPPSLLADAETVDQATGMGMGNLFISPLIAEGEKWVNILQIQFLQPIYSFSFSNGLIACMVLLGIGTLLDVGFVMARPFRSMFLAICGELGTVIALPMAIWMGLPLADAAATATIGGADGPMILFAALLLSPELFVPITVVAYLYLGLTYGGYPFIVKAMVPRKIRGMPMPPEKARTITPDEKIVFAVVACLSLSLLFPVAAPLFMALFLGVIIRESGLTHYQEIVSGPVLYIATLFLGLLLGVLCEASTILKPEVFILLVIGITALTFSAIGGILGGYVLYFVSGKKYNPVIGVAAVSCVPTCAKVAQKCVSEVNPGAIILPHALGCNISGVITSAIFASVLISLVRATGGGAF
jgi:oxaloacetate decarboxylase beta subunit